MQAVLTGDVAPICKLQQQTLDAVLDLMMHVPLPAELLTIILLKVLKLYDQYTKYPVKVYVDQQLKPRVILFVTRMFETNTTANQYLQIIATIGNSLLSDQITVQWLNDILAAF